MISARQRWFGAAALVGCSFVIFFMPMAVVLGVAEAFDDDVPLAPLVVPDAGSIVLRPGESLNLGPGDVFLSQHAADGVLCTVHADGGVSGPYPQLCAKRDGGVW